MCYSTKALTGMVQPVSIVEVVATRNPPTTRVTTRPVNEVSEVRLDDELKALCKRTDYPLSDQKRHRSGNCSGRMGKSLKLVQPNSEDSHWS